MFSSGEVGINLFSAMTLIIYISIHYNILIKFYKIKKPAEINLRVFIIFKSY